MRGLFDPNQKPIRKLFPIAIMHGSVENHAQHNKRAKRELNVLDKTNFRLAQNRSAVRRDACRYFRFPANFVQRVRKVFGEQGVARCLAMLKYATAKCRRRCES